MRRIFTLVLACAVTIVCARFGVWQLDRLGQKKAENALITARAALPRLPLTGLATDELMTYRAVVARGTFDFDRQLVRVGRPMDGIPGVVVLTPLILPDGGAILVERGWAPSPDARQVELGRLGEPPGAVVNGILVSPSDTEFPLNPGWPLYVRSVNLEALGERFPYVLVPWVLRRVDSPPIVDSVVFRSVRTPDLSNGPHLNYALQWFSFGVIALVGGLILVFRTDPGAPSRPPARD